MKQNTCNNRIPNNKRKVDFIIFSVDVYFDNYKI